jgi:hypothetical protein
MYIIYSNKWLHWKQSKLGDRRGIELLACCLLLLLIRGVSYQLKTKHAYKFKAMN